QNFTPANTALTYSNSFLTADVNNDHIKDIITSTGQVFLGMGDGLTYRLSPILAFTPPTGNTNFYAPSMVAADFDHDSTVDLAIDDGRSISIFIGVGNGAFAPGPSYSAIPNRSYLVATDLDGDGNIDLFSGTGGNGGYGGDDYLPNEAYALMGNGD